MDSLCTLPKDLAKLIILILVLLSSVISLNSAGAVIGGPYTNKVSAELGSASESSGKGFSPEDIIVSAGTTVLWTNDDSSEHTVTSGIPGDPDSGKLFDSGFPWKPGATFEHKFDTPGEFPYFCKIHPWTRGKVTVAEVTIAGENGIKEEHNVKVSYDNKTFDVTLSMSNGSVKSIRVDNVFTSIILEVETSSTEDGELIISLPRALIDSKSDGRDDKFTLLVNLTEEVDYEEVNTTDKERELRIPVQAGVFEVEIVGTQVVPEFPLGLAVITAAMISVIVAMTRIRKSGNLC